MLSLGGSFRMHNTETVSLSLREDNFLGYGDQVRVQSLFDATRAEKFGYGFDYTKRNILGSFVNASAGFTNFGKTFNNGEREEREAYINVDKTIGQPLYEMDIWCGGRAASNAKFLQSRFFVSTRV